jgi:inner membrane protein
MDPLSQAALGASWAQSGARSPNLVGAGLLGATAAMAPDLDALIQSSRDPLLFLEYHRHFTHSFVFVPVGALLCAMLFHRFVRGRTSFVRTYVLCFLGFASHGLLDACTSYGTQLLWPFSDARIAWSIVSVVDPAFTLPVLALVVLAGLKRRPHFALAAAAWAAAYLALGAAQNARAAAVGQQIAASRGHVPQRLEAKPALGSILLWKIIYEHDDRYYVDAVRTGVTPTIYPGESTAKLDLAEHFPWLEPGSRQALDVERFRRISDDFLTVDDDDPDRIVDMRYSMLPNEIEGFWAIALDPLAASDQHVRYVTTRENASAQARRLIGMLWGRAPQRVPDQTR